MLFTKCVLARFARSTAAINDCHVNLFDFFFVSFVPIFVSFVSGF